MGRLPALRFGRQVSPFLSLRQWNVQKSVLICYSFNPLLLRLRLRFGGQVSKSAIKVKQNQRKSIFLLSRFPWRLRSTFPFSSCAIKFRVLIVMLPVLGIPRRELFITDNEKILGVALFSCFSKVERPRNHDFVLDDHHLVVSNSVGCIDLGRDTGIGQSRSDAFGKSRRRNTSPSAGSCPEGLEP